MSTELYDIKMTASIVISLVSLLVIVIQAADPKVVTFSAYRTGRFHQVDNKNTVIPYQGVRLNAGGGLNNATGLFTAPLAGNYLFSFQGLSSFREVSSRSHNPETDKHVVTRVFLAKNEETTLGTSYAALSGRSLSIFVIVPLDKGDRVGAVLHTGQLYDTKTEFFTRFSGTLLS